MHEPLSDEQCLTALEFTYGGHSEDELEYSARIITTRRAHDCVGALSGKPHPICPGTRAAVEKCLLAGEGWKTAYTCDMCLEDGYERYTAAQGTQ